MVKVRSYWNKVDLLQYERCPYEKTPRECIEDTQCEDAGEAETPSPCQGMGEAIRSWERGTEETVSQSPPKEVTLGTSYLS